MGWTSRFSPSRLRARLAARARRGRERGAVAVEFALSLFLLIPLLLATLDYGHYFWVGLHATEAASAGARAGAAIIRNAPGGCTNVALVGSVGSPASTVPQNASYEAKRVVDLEMAKTFLTPTMWQNSPGGITQSCVTVSGLPAWSVGVRVDFPPPVSFMLPFMPQSSTATYTRYISRTVVMP